MYYSFKRYKACIIIIIIIDKKGESMLKQNMSLVMIIKVKEHKNKIKEMSIK
jgi:hypothetical protein